MSLTLVTGAPGWLGSRFVEVLLAGLPDVGGLSAPASDRKIRLLEKPGLDAGPLAASPNVEVVRGDLRDTGALSDFCRGAEGGVLFHAAGLVHPAIFIRDLYSVNVDGMRNLLEAAEAAGVRRVVVVSSNSPAGTNPTRTVPFDESSPDHPYMNYGRSKLQMEALAKACHARGRTETVILRPTWFYGINQPERQTTFFRMIRRGGAPILGDGGNLRSMSYIDNVCQAMLLAERTAKAAGQMYWVADARAYPMNEIVDTVERLMEEEFSLPVAHKRMRLPAIAGDAAWLADGTLQALGLYQQKVHVLSEMNKNIFCSIEKARRDLGYDPKIGLEEGMRRSIAWCLRAGIAL